MSSRKHTWGRLIVVILVAGLAASLGQAGVVENASRRMTAGDFDNDGINEVAFLYTNGQIYVQNFANPAASGLVTTQRASAITAADLDGNGTPEIAFVNAATGQLQSYSAATSTVTTHALPGGVTGLLTVAAGNTDGVVGDELMVISRTSAQLSGTPYIRSTAGTWTSPGGALSKLTAAPVEPGNPNDVLLGRNSAGIPYYYGTAGWTSLGGDRIDQITAGNYYTSDAEAEPFGAVWTNPLYVHNGGAWRTISGSGQAPATGRVDGDLPATQQLSYVIGTGETVFASRLDWTETTPSGWTFLQRDASSSPGSPDVYGNSGWKDLLVADIDNDGLDEVITRSNDASNRLHVFHNGDAAFAPTAAPQPQRPTLNPVQGADLKLWLDASRITGLANGDPVATWADASGNSNDATAAGSKQPAYIATSSLGGRPVVRFDGTDDGMATALDISSPDYTVFALFNYNDSTSAMRRAVQGSNNWLIGPYNNELRHYAAGWVSTGTAVTPTEFYLAEATNDGAASLFRVDGVNRTTSSSPTGVPGTIHLGGSGAFPAELLNGDMAEVLVYDRALTNRESNRVGMYFQDKYGLAGGYNLALGETVIDGSSAYNGQPFNAGSYPARFIVDGRLDDTSTQTFWLGSDGDPTEYVTVDLGVATDIQSLVLRNTHNGSSNDRGTRDFRVWASNTVDGGNQLISPTLILDGTLTTSIGPNGDTLIPLDIFNAWNGLKTGSYRYVKFETLTSSFGFNHVGLNELQVFDTVLSANLAPRSSIITYSGQYDAAHSVDRVIDQRVDEDAGVGGAAFWLGRQTTMDEYFILDLGSSFLVDRIELQNTHNGTFDDRGTADFEIWASTQVDALGQLVNPMLILDSMLMSRAGYGYDIPFDVFSVFNGDFSAFDARYIQFVASTYWGVGSGLNEIRVFGAVPEPGTLTLLALGGLGLLRRRRRKA
ncbi:PEP-CTERM sorting domain-containing protein [bacterium]|nr:PEP-CTERM sorting domain-containing protein [bacterium]